MTTLLSENVKGIQLVACRAVFDSFYPVALRSEDTKTFTVFSVSLSIGTPIACIVGVAWPVANISAYLKRGFILSNFDSSF